MIEKTVDNCSICPKNNEYVEINCSLEKLGEIFTITMDEPFESSLKIKTDHCAVAMHFAAAAAWKAYELYSGRNANPHVLAIHPNYDRAYSEG